MKTCVKNFRLFGLPMISGMTVFLFFGWTALGMNQVDGEKVQPPGGAEIFDTMNRLWKDGKYAEADAYARELHDAWGGYIPAEVNWMVHAFRFGAQIEDCIERGQTLQAAMDGNIELASPMFAGELTDFLHRTEGLLGAYEKDRVLRSAKWNPLLSNASGKKDCQWWCAEDWLYCLAPECFLIDGNVQWRRNGPQEPKMRFSDVSEKDLLWRQGVDGVTLSEKAEISRELVRRLEEVGAATVVHEFLRRSVLYTYPDLVASLMATPDEAVPALVAFMDAPIDRYNPAMQRKMAIWALVRIGRADEEVMRVLEECRAAHPADELGDYAARAAEYLAKRGTQ